MNDPQPAQPARFTIVIPHRGNTDTLRSTLEALVAAILPAKDEIVIVNNGPAGNLDAILESPALNLRVIDNGCNNGFGRACNQGIKSARGQYILLLNNDAVIAASALDQFEAFFQAEPTAGLLAPQLVGFDGVLQRSTGYYPDFASETGLGKKRKPAPDTRKSIPVETVVGACMAIRKKTIEGVGALDEDFFFYFEETEWCHRINHSGWKVWWLPEIKVIHGKGVSTRVLRREAQIEMFRSRLLYYRKTMGAFPAEFLIGWRTLRLLVNVFAYVLLVLVTLGARPKLREKLLTYLTLLAWLLVGQPEGWGLPDKCPRLK